MSNNKAEELFKDVLEHKDYVENTIVAVERHARDRFNKGIILDKLKQLSKNPKEISLLYRLFISLDYRPYTLMNEIENLFKNPILKYLTLQVAEYYDKKHPDIFTLYQITYQRLENLVEALPLLNINIVDFIELFGIENVAERNLLPKNIRYPKFINSVLSNDELSVDEKKHYVINSNYIKLQLHYQDKYGKVE